MSWLDLRRGNWSGAAPLDRLDPYVVWADATGFLDFSAVATRADSPRTPETVPVLMELDPAALQSELDPMRRDAATTAVPPARALKEDPPRPDPPRPDPPRPDPSRPGGDRREEFLQWERVLLRLSAGTAFGFALVPPLPFFTAIITPGFYGQLAREPRLKRLIRRIEVSRPVSLQRRTSASIFWFGNTDFANSPVAGVIDDGCAFAHSKFRPQPGQTRIWALWDQDGKIKGPVTTPPPPPPPPALPAVEPSGVLHRPELQTLMASATPPGKPLDEDLCYSLASYGRLRRQATHGMHVLDVLAGSVPPSNRAVVPGRAPPTFEKDPGSSAGQADIVFVQLQESAIQDDSGKWLGVQVLDAILFICSHAPPGGCAVVNLSYGPHHGPHDGSSMLEQAIDATHDVAAIYGRTLSVTLPAGNSFANRSHADIELLGHEEKDLLWQVPPGSETSAFLEIWLPPGEVSPLLDELTVELLPPKNAGPSSGPVGVGEMKGLFNPNLLASVVFLANVPQSDGRTMILVAIAPTFSYSRTRAWAPCGTWTVRLRNRGGSKVSPVHAYVVRNGTTLGAKLRGRQSHLYDGQFDPTRYLRSAQDDPPVRLSTLQRRETLSGIATGTRPSVAAGYVMSNQRAAAYSSAGPSMGTPPRNPNFAAVSDERTSLPGLRGAGTRSGSHVRVAGTSIAAPQLARRIIDSLTAVDVASPSGDDPRIGAGMVPLP